MEFNFSIKELIPGHITVIEPLDTQSCLKIYDLENCNNKSEESNWICNNTSSNIIYNTYLIRKKENLEVLINQIGLASAKAQELLSPITTFKKLLASNNQKVYILREKTEPYSIIGFLKIGRKRLFICDDSNVHREIDATCILDFYVHESKQLCGFGHQLFEAMLQNEIVKPEKLAIDRPSMKFLSFLNKHYNLKDPKPQANNFVVYSGFFGENEIRVSDEAYFDTDDGCNHNLSNSFSDQQMHPDSNLEEMNNSPNLKTDANTGIDGYFKKRRVPSAYNTSGVSSWNSHKDQKNWGVFEALHSYSGNDSFMPRPRTPAQCTSTPSREDNKCNQQKWNQLQSSWNILGVKPLDFSKTEK